MRAQVGHARGAEERAAWRAQVHHARGAQVESAQNEGEARPISATERSGPPLKEGRRPESKSLGVLSTRLLGQQERIQMAATSEVLSRSMRIRVLPLLPILSQAFGSSPGAGLQHAERLLPAEEAEGNLVQARVR